MKRLEKHGGSLKIITTKTNIMKTIQILLLSLIITVTQQITTSSNHGLEGTWKIDLRPTPDAEPYFTKMTISEVSDKSIKGRFYGSSMSSGLLNTSWTKTYFAFTTSDANHTYYHSGYYLDGKVYGISYCPTRQLTAPWTGEKD